MGKNQYKTTVGTIGAPEFSCLYLFSFIFSTEMKVSLLVLTILFTAVCAGKLDEKHNEILQLKCGISKSRVRLIAIVIKTA